MSEPTSTAHVREHLIGALEADLIGPFLHRADPKNAPPEILKLPPRRWYLTGFLAPAEGRETEDPTSEEEAEAGDDETEEEAAAAEPSAKQPKVFPASMGMSVLLPPTAGSGSVEATVRFAEYTPEHPVGDDGKVSRKTQWRRVRWEPVVVPVPLDAKALAKGLPVGGAVGIVLKGKLEVVPRAKEQGLPEGCRALSLFLVNERTPGDRGRLDAEYIFQVSLEVACATGFCPRPNRKDEKTLEWDDRVADLQFRNKFEWGVGHNVAVEVVATNEAKQASRLRTTWIPRVEVPRVVTHKTDGITLEMDALGALTASTVRGALEALPALYGTWIAEQRQRRDGIDSDERRGTQASLMNAADEAKRRIEAGIAALIEKRDVLEAFTMANRAIATYARRRSPETYVEGKAPPTWRMFQLAFVVMNLASVENERDAFRENVELIFFPTGGGKTEAYLGLIAFTLVLRRLRGQSRPDKGLGVAVLLRYTLRLLTLDQLGRAATVLCALETMRRQDPARLGDVRFAVGLWVGRSATANTMKEVARKITEYKNSSSKSAPSPFPLTKCPWCRTGIEKDCFTVGPNRTNPTEVVVACLNPECDFSAARHPEGIPVLFVDEQIYRELPSFVVGTVDKFAMMPWRGETGMLFGRAHARLGRAFFGPIDGPNSKAAKGADPLPDGLRPPELIVQDELHLISGPLGTMVGLYETAIEALCTREDKGAFLKPKIVASTATVRRATEQVQALFNRPISLFPPPGIDEGETFFGTVDRTSPGRLYIGVAAPGRALKAILLRTYVDLLAGAAKVYDEKANARTGADPYMTVAGYFNSLRELGGMRRLVEDEVRGRVLKIEERVPEDSGPNPWFKNRTIQQEPVELTSRESTAKIATAKARLDAYFNTPDRVDVLLASNMISVGVDIDRLGVMVVAGQPKTTSEYIQASSRVGRDATRPGLVVTCFNVAKPRDRSHYERFGSYHESFYRFVEVQSLTPFSGPALDRGLAGVLVAMTRLLDRTMTPPHGAMDVGTRRDLTERVISALAKRAAEQPLHGIEDKALEQSRISDTFTRRAASLLDTWKALMAKARSGEGERVYSDFDLEGSGRALLKLKKEGDSTDEDRFVAPMSMRDVEPSTHIWVQRSHLGGRS
ncbi:MAG: DISARM system helicase DrmA [Polyangiaceae bacterium]